MKTHLSTLLICIITSTQLLQAQSPKLRILDSAKGVNLRGLSASSESEIWASGSNGAIAHSTDGGTTWKWQTVKGQEQRDFRDIQALGPHSAVTIGVDTPAIILRTANDGKSWQKVYENNQAGMFLDALDFKDSLHGVVLGDPIDGQIFTAYTTDGGFNWQQRKAPFKQSPDEGEAFFAASGTNILLTNDGQVQIISGGTRSRFWKEGQDIAPLPLQAGKTYTGPNGMAQKNQTIAVVGGDFSQPFIGDSAFAISQDGGRSWEAQNTLPGYGSGVAIITDSTLVACGLTGVWISYNQGRSWITIDKRPFNTLLYIPQTGKLFLAGPQGRIAVIEGL